MAVTQYEQNGEKLWRVYLNLRSSENPTIRIQRKLSGLKSECAALAEEKKLLSELSKQITRIEVQGCRWEEVIERWERDKLSYRMTDYAETTIQDYAAMLRNWTQIWFGRPASELNRGDGREVLRLVQEMGKPARFVRRLKNTINQVYTWGMEEKLITDVHHTPVYGIDIGKEKEEKLPEILTRNEVQMLIREADKREHKWAPIWKGALLTGMRSGELNGLPWCNVEMISPEEARNQDALQPENRRYGLIRVHRTWNTRMKSYGPTKGGYWRTVPISHELYWFLVDLKRLTGTSEFVFPRFRNWQRGMQATVLRKFCLDVGLKSIKFHTLRACFATLLISGGVAPTRVMKICGWKDLKTMQHYIRMAGIDEQGATEGLNLLPPDPGSTPGLPIQSDVQVMDHVVRLLDFRARK